MVKERIQQITGGTLVPLGFILVALGVIRYIERTALIADANAVAVIALQKVQSEQAADLVTMKIQYAADAAEIRSSLAIIKARLPGRGHETR